MTKAVTKRHMIYLVTFFVLVILLVISIIAGVVLGPSETSPTIVFNTLMDGVRSAIWGTEHETGGIHTIVLNIRLPRVILACLVGACLALAGAIMQALFQNPMADPYIIGVSGGAALGAVTAMMLGISLEFLGLTAVPLLAFVGAVGITFLVYMLSVRGGRIQTATLLLTGVAIGSLVASLTSLLMLSSDELQPSVLYWMLGGLSGRDWVYVNAILPQFIIGITGAMLLARPLNVLLLGDETALNVGLDVQRTKRWLLLLSSLLAAGAVAVSGVIGFVGLVVPHICRLIIGPDHRVLLPVSALAGAVLVVLADILARMILKSAELPIGIVTSLVGCPFFLYLLHQHGARRL